MSWRGRAQEKKVPRAETHRYFGPSPCRKIAALALEGEAEAQPLACPKTVSLTAVVGEAEEQSVALLSLGLVVVRQKVL